MLIVSRTKGAETVEMESFTFRLSSWAAMKGTESSTVREPPPLKETDKETAVLNKRILILSCQLYKVVKRYKIELERAKISIRKKNWAKPRLKTGSPGKPLLMRKVQPHKQSFYERHTKNRKNVTRFSEVKSQKLLGLHKYKQRLQHRWWKAFNKQRSQLRRRKKHLIRSRW